VLLKIKKTSASKPKLRIIDSEVDPLFADYGPVEEPSQSRGRPRRRERAAETFARIPHDRAFELYRHIGGAAWVILIELDHLILAQHGKNPVLFWSPRLRNVFASSTRSKALRQLEAAGVVRIEERGRGLSPWVTHLWYPRQR
jgi:hypothetical protein